MNRKILTRAVQIIAFIALIGVLFYSCESNPVEQEMTTRSTEFHTMAPGELPQPMIVGGEEVETWLQQNGHWQGAEG